MFFSTLKDITQDKRYKKKKKSLNKLKLMIISLKFV